MGKNGLNKEKKKEQKTKIDDLNKKNDQENQSE